MKHNNSVRGIATPAIIGIVAVILVVIGIGYFAQKQDAPAVSEGEKMMEKKEDTMVEKESDAMMDKDPSDAEVMEDKDAMIKYSGTVLAGTSAPLLDFKKADYDAALKTDKLVVLYFYANWCPICKAEFPQMQAAFNELTADNVIGFRVNYNDDETDADEKALAREFGVPYQHTKVFVKNGERVLKSPEGWNTARYRSEIKAYSTQ